MVALFNQLVMLPADQPGLGGACSSAMISQEPSVHATRRRIHAELHRRVRTVLRSGAWPEVAQTLEFGLVGAMVQASSGSATFQAMADELARVVTTLFARRFLTAKLQVTRLPAGRFAPSLRSLDLAVTNSST